MTPYPWATASVTMQSYPKVMALVEAIMARSQWFAVMPLPDDAYEVTMKQENTTWLRCEADTINAEQI
jgi:hypothetical protein